MEPVDTHTKIDSTFIRHRNVLMLKGQFTPIYTDLILHLMEEKIKHKEVLTSTLKDLLALLPLHLTARPWAETLAWTINLRAPRVNFFVTGGSVEESIVGTVFTENIRETDRNLLYSQTLLPGKESRKSTIDLQTNDPIEWIERYYEQSEQRPARAFRLPDENYVLLAAQPQADLEWLESLTQEDVLEILDKEETKLLETRKFRFHCGCSAQKLIDSLQGYKGHSEELFQGDPALEVTCPRCGKKYIVTPDMLE